MRYETALASVRFQIHVKHSFGYPRDLLSPYSTKDETSWQDHGDVTFLRTGSAGREALGLFLFMVVLLKLSVMATGRVYFLFIFHCAFVCLFFLGLFLFCFVFRLCILSFFFYIFFSSIFLYFIFFVSSFSLFIFLLFLLLFLLHFFLLLLSFLFLFIFFHFSIILQQYYIMIFFSVPDFDIIPTRPITLDSLLSTLYSFLLNK